MTTKNKTMPAEMTNLCHGTVISRRLVLVLILTVHLLTLLTVSATINDHLSVLDDNLSANSENSIERDFNPILQLAPTASHQHFACGTIARNKTHISLKNPHHPEPTYVKAICEIVIERFDKSIKNINIKFKQFELYRPTYDGTCLHDRFAVYTDLNMAVTPIICGNHTGKNISIPFLPAQTSLIISVSTSDLDYDRSWVLDIEQKT